MMAMLMSCFQSLMVVGMLMFYFRDGYGAAADGDTEKKRIETREERANKKIEWSGIIIYRERGRECCGCCCC